MLPDGSTSAARGMTPMNRELESGSSHTQPPLPKLSSVPELFAAKLALTLRSPLMVIEHGPVPLHAPLQPVKVAFAAGVAVRVTTAPIGIWALHAAPQLIPEGLEVTVPLPLRVTVRRWL